MLRLIYKPNSFLSVSSSIKFTNTFLILNHSQAQVCWIARLCWTSFNWSKTSAVKIWLPNTSVSSKNTNGFNFMDWSGAEVGACKALWWRKSCRVDINKTLAGLPLHGYFVGNGRHESQSLYNFFIKMNQFAHANFTTCLNYLMWSDLLALIARD